jgi:hypothetical protein
MPPRRRITHRTTSPNTNRRPLKLPNGYTLQETKACIHNKGKTGKKIGGAG